MNDKSINGEFQQSQLTKEKAVPTGHIFKQLLRVCHPNAFVILKAFVIPDVLLSSRRRRDLNPA